MSVLAQYSAVQKTVDGVGIVVLRDNESDVEAAIIPSLGNIAYSMKVKGEELFWSPFASPAEAKKAPALFGNPLLAPWANRIEGMSYVVNGKKHDLQKGVAGLRMDANGNPIHGLLLFTDQWKVEDVSAEGGVARVRCRLDFDRPEWLAQFPFAHTLRMTYELKRGVLAVITEIENKAQAPLPVAIGYHPYYRLPGGRDKWTVRIPAEQHVKLSKTLIPTGEKEPVANGGVVALKGAQLDDVYSGLVRDSSGNADFSMTDGKRTVTFAFGPKFQVGVVYAPPGKDFICFEPMAVITDAFNQNERGKYDDLQSIKPGTTWRETWSIRASGF